MRLKIICRREAGIPSSGDNAVVDYSAMDRLLVATRRQLLGPGGEQVAIVVLLLLAIYGASRFESNGGPPGTSRAIMLSLLTLVPVVLCRSRPALAAAAATLLTVTVLRTENPALTVVSVCITLFLLAHLVVRRGLLVAAPLLIPFLVLAVVRLSGPYNALGSTAPLLFCLAALAVGESVRRRKLAVEALDATEEAMAESARAQTVMEERARIARELHDIVAHHLSVIAIESEAVRLTLPNLPAAAGERLGSIAATAREALTETRRLLGVLREDTGDKSDRTPQPGLDQLDDLIVKAESTGTHIRCIRRGTVAALPLRNDLAAYRIVQEALTNARRHAPGADVDVELSYDAAALDLRVRDYGAGPPSGEAVEGHGLLGVRERAVLAGGTFSAGHAEGGGFEVHVILPTAATP